MTAIPSIGLGEILIIAGMAWLTLAVLSIGIAAAVVTRNREPNK